jgi:ABC-2 type transport system permease protein
MKFLRIKAIAKKEILQIIRDPLSLAIGFLMPVILLLIFGYAITFDISNIKTVVHDQDRSSLSRELIEGFSASGYFSIIAYAERPQEIDRSLDSGRAKVAVIIPRDFTKDIRAGRQAQLGVVFDGSDANTATIAQGYVAAVTALFTERIAGARAVPLVDARIRVWYNPELKSRNFITPGLIAVIMSVIVALLTSLTVAREWERGTMEQLISTPVKKQELILGKLAPYFLIGAFDTLVAVLMATLLFDVPLRGSAALLALFSGVFLFGGLCWGIFISIAAKSQLLASQMAMVSTFLPAFLLSGFMINITNMPRFIQPLTYIIPARYFVAISKGLFLKASAFGLLAVDGLLLAVYGLLVFAAANKKFKKRIG